MNPRTRLLIARCKIGLVLLINLHCAIQFLIRPDYYQFGFELTGVPGSAMVQGMGLLFIMWNVPYSFALSHPVHKRNSLIEAMIMQFIGVVGESILLYRLPVSYVVLKSTVQRFILFDGFGFILLLSAYFITRSLKSGD